VAVTLPRRREGFFLPAIEAMALGTIAVCPDCIGNRSFCRDGDTAFRTPYDLDALVAATLAALALDPARADALRTAAAAEARRHSIDAERSAFLRILDRP
jgi:glycosyltransferase involved in cell wall biosynthesis